MEDRLLYQIQLLQISSNALSLTNAPASFQRFMDNVFKDLPDVCVVIYLDDIHIYSDNPNEHVKQVNKVLDHLIKHSLFAKLRSANLSLTRSSSWVSSSTPTASI